MLTREKGQSIVIYDGNGLFVEVVIADIRNEKIRLGITAPREIIVDRKEIYMRKKRNGNNKRKEID